MTGHQQVDFGRNKFMGYCYAPFIGTLTDDRQHIKMGGRRYTTSATYHYVLCGVNLKEKISEGVRRRKPLKGFVTLPVLLAERRIIKMKKVAIMTFHAANNFGAVLQNYALQKVLKDVFHTEVETIDYHCDAIDGQYGIWQKKDKLRRHIWNLINLLPELIRRKFNEFRKKFLLLSKSCSIQDLYKYSEAYDIYICGSDQVWNKEIIKDNLSAYLLDFVSTKPKFAYAASAGNGIIEDELLVSKIKQLNYITVRESELKDFLVSKGIECNCVCDPVFLLEKSRWMTILAKQTKKDYVFLYYIDSNKELCEAIAKTIASNEDKKICCPCKIEKTNLFCKYKSYGAGPAEFLTDIFYADMIVASSFHAIAFSIIFEKQFIAVPHNKTGQRVIDLLDYLGLSDRIVTSYRSFEQKKIKTIDYNSIRNKLTEWRLESMKDIRKIVDWEEN